MKKIKEWFNKVTGRLIELVQNFFKDTAISPVVAVFLAVYYLYITMAAWIIVGGSAFLFLTWVLPALVGFILLCGEAVWLTV